MKAANEVERTLDMAEEALDRGDPESALDLCQEVLDQDDGHPGALFLTAEAHRDLRELPAAEARYRDAIKVAPHHSSSWSGLANVLFDQLRFEESRSASLRAIRIDDANPEAFHLRGLLRERRGDFFGAARDFRRATLLDPGAYPLPVPLDDGTVEAVVEEAVRAMHPSIRDYLQQVAILLDEVPDDELLRQWDPPAPPGEILGYFSGTSLADRSTGNPWTNLPSAIVLFRRNLQRIAADHDRMIEELRVTVIHEIGHFLGLTEEDLEERGLD